MTKFIPLLKPRVEDPIIQREGPKPSVGIDPALLDLVRLRIAQIRQSPVAVEKHGLDLLARGESAERLDQLHLWSESSLFNAKEKAALTLGEAIFSDPTRPIINQPLEGVRDHFKPEELIALLLAIMAVNDQSYFTSQDAPEGATSTGLLKRAKLVQTHSLPSYWRKLAHQLADRGNVKE